MQAPPMFSAVKRGGVPLYRLARQGIEVERQPRPVEVFELELRVWELPELTLDITCSAGTYVRALAHDVGQALGCGAHLTALTRLASGDFRLEDSVAIDDFESAASENRWHEFLLPIHAALAHFPAVQLDPDLATRLCNGQTIPARAANSSGLDDDSQQPDGLPPVNDPLDEFTTDRTITLVRVHGLDGGLLAVATFDPETNVLRPHKVFHTPRDNQCA